MSWSINSGIRSPGLTGLQRAVAEPLVETGVPCRPRDGVLQTGETDLPRQTPGSVPEPAERGQDALQPRH